MTPFWSNDAPDLQSLKDAEVSIGFLICPANGGFIQTFEGDDFVALVGEINVSEAIDAGACREITHQYQSSSAQNGLSTMLSKQVICTLVGVQPT